MFTGIVQGTGRVTQIQHNEITRFVIDFDQVSVEGLERGASVAVSGVCLTVATFEGREVSFDVIPETLKLTHLGEAEIGTRLNLERSLKMGDELGGHLLSGHIMGCGVVTAHTEIHSEGEGSGLDLEIQAPAELMKFIQPKGYIAVDGASLTIGEVRGDRFMLHLIPETLRLTTLGDRREGARVNLEIDAMTQSVVNTTERLFAQQSQNHVEASNPAPHPITIICGSFHTEEVTQMLNVAVEEAEKRGLSIDEVVWVPGSMEVPLALKRALSQSHVIGAACLGIIERGQTMHGEVMGHAVTRAIIDLQLQYDKPIGLGIIGPGAEPHHIPPRLEPHARAAIAAIDAMYQRP